MVLNSLLGLLDHQRKVYLEEAGRMINLAEGVSFWGAMNEGSTFTGTLPMDKALKDRFRLVVECAFLDAATEVDVLNAKTGLDTDNCRRLVEVANQVRLKAMSDNLDSFSDAISTRMLESAAQGLVLGGTKTLNYTLLNHYSAGGPTGQSERDNLRKLLVGKFGSI
jgi:MoxR-like ATPase